jgi:octopine/nopaline transport system ATP-binding protein
MSVRFPSDYFAAREDFLRAAKEAGARLEAFPIQARGPGGEPLSIDVAWLGSPQARRVLVISSATHGVEGPAGTASQVQFLTEDWPAYSLPADSGVVLIHANNPFGYAWGRRTNEDNVDLNRNFLDWGREATPVRAEYAEVAPLLNPTEFDSASSRAFLKASGRLVKERGEPWVQARFTEGQYAHPQGLYFGGSGPVESNVILRGIFGRALEAAEEALVIDVHTGMGAYGDHLLVSSHLRDDAAHDWLCRHFAEARVEAVMNGDTRWPAVSGKMGTAIAKAHPACALRWFSLEFGTFEGVRMILGERAENWLFHHGDRASVQGREILAEVWEGSSPADDAWRRRVLNGARATILDGWRGLFGSAGFSGGAGVSQIAPQQA